MSFILRILPVVLCAAAAALAGAQASAQTTDGKASDKQAASRPAETATQDSPRSADEYAEAARLVNGPAGNPECMWLGRRVVALLARDETETAVRNLELYDRFGCPGPHVQASFRCVVRQGVSEPNSQQVLNARVHACWVNPSAPQATAAKPPASTGSASQ